MTANLLDYHSGPWTEEDFFALHGTPQRIELFDGSLLVSPSPSGIHQHVARRLANALEAPSRAAGLEVVEAVDVRLRKGRIFIPDVLLTPDLHRKVFEASDVALVAEVVSPSNAVNDRVLKMHLYAEARIPAYLLVEPEEDAKTTTASLYLLDGEHYRPARTAAAGRPLRIEAPVRLDLDPAELLRR